MTGEPGTDAATVPPGGWERVFARSPIAMGIAVDFRYVHANKAYCELVGRPLEDLVGTDARELFAAGTDESIQQVAEQVRHGAARIHLDAPFVRPDGEVRHVSIDAFVVAEDEETGRITSVVQAVDVTDAHRIREQDAASERRFRKLLINSRDVVTLIDAQGELVYTTVHQTGALGYGQDYWNGVHPGDVVHPDDRETAANAWARALERPGETVEAEVRMLDAAGEWVDVILSGINLLDDADIAGVLMTARDITDVRQAERLATSQSEVLELIARGAPLSEILERCMELVEENGVGGRSSVYLLEDDFLEIRSGRAPQPLNDWMRDPPRTPPRCLCDVAIASGEAAFIPDVADAAMHDGLRTLAEQLGIRAAWSQPIHSAGSGEVVGTLSTLYDVPHTPTRRELLVGELACSLVSIALEREATEARLAHQALHDALTGLPNRSLLVDRLDHALERRRRTEAEIAVLFCDLDRFKVVNDSLGHSVGDQLLVAFADRLLAAVDPGDTVARFGGDEFVVLLEDVSDPSRPVDVAERIRASLEQPFGTDAGQDVYLTASMGLAVASDHVSGDGWLRDADAAMYRAKERGRNRLELFDSAMRDAAVIRLQVENDLRRAVDRDELTVHYQPIVDLRSGRVVGAEALVRWLHPVRGLLQPDDFILVAEETGTIESIGSHVLDRAVGELSEVVGRRGLTGFRLGVNLSARQLDHGGLDELVVDVCRRHGWPLGDLLLEITETVLTDEPVAPLDVLGRIRDLGVDLAIDDFGTGHSSLTRLGRMPVNQVKIDRSFVAAIDRGDERLVRIVDAVVAVASALDLRTCAEGVETQAQLDYLRRIRCDLAQGYFFAKPLPLDELEDLLGSDPRW
ncbi:MAG: EAL domain-containing protein [Actinobacteria bacterium]|nr:EAL domain-containing protein [Actinomycetota bacterium]